MQIVNDNGFSWINDLNEMVVGSTVIYVSPAVFRHSWQGIAGNSRSCDLK